MRRTLPLLLLASTLALSGCGLGPATSDRPRQRVEDHASPTARRVAEAAMAQARTTKRYDPKYVEIPYPGGDVPKDRGVCTDVVVRAFRSVGVDLQVAVHEDMASAFPEYPDRWGLAHPDPNIDHRRVPNLRTFFDRKGKALPVSDLGSDYQPGDVVTWDIGGRPHTGVVSTRRNADGTRFCIAHHYGGGVRVEDVLFRFPISGHYRFF